MSYSYERVVDNIRTVGINLDSLRTSVNAIATGQSSLRTSVNAMMTLVEWIATSLGYSA